MTHFTNWGDPDSPSRALIIHGLSSSGASWWRVAEALASEGWFVTAPDLRGHGTSPRAATYSFEDFVSDLPPGSFDLVIGHSLGGAISVVAGSRHGYTGGLVLLDPVLEVPEDQWEQIKADQLAELELSAETIAASKPHWSERDVALKLEAVAHVDRDAIARAFDDNPGWNLVQQTTELRVSTLILGGDHAVHSMLAKETAEAICAANPHVTYRVIAGAGHSPHRDRPDDTLAEILAFAHS